MQFVQPLPFEEAAFKIGDRSPIGAILNSAQWRKVPVGLRERAFFSATIESVRFLQRSQDFIGDFLSGAKETLPNGETALKAGSRAQFIRDLAEFAEREGLGPLDPSDAGTIKDITSEARLGLIFDTQVQAAQDYGNWLQGMDADVLNEFPAQRFIREREVQVPRPYHQLNENRVELKTNLNFWLSMNPDFGVPWGPWGFGSGMGVEDVDREEAITSGLMSQSDRLRPVDKDFNESLRASTRGLGPRLVESLQRVFGDQIEIIGDSAIWKSQPADPAPAPAPQTPRRPAAEPPQNRRPAGPALPKPVSLAIDLTDTRLALPMLEEVRAGYRLIDSVHDDGELPQIRLTKASPHATFEAAYNRENPRILISPRSTLVRHAVIHETGHFLDHQVLGLRGYYASQGHSALTEWREAIEDSKAVRALRADYERYPTALNEYMVRGREMWARAYAQYITLRSGDARLKEQLPLIEQALRSHAVWTDDDFAPIATAMDNLFRKKGWR